MTENGNWIDFTQTDTIHSRVIDGIKYTAELDPLYLAFLSSLLQYFYSHVKYHFNPSKSSLPYNLSSKEPQCTITYLHVSRFSSRGTKSLKMESRWRLDFTWVTKWKNWSQSSVVRGFMSRSLWIHFDAFKTKTNKYDTSLVPFLFAALICEVVFPIGNIILFWIPC